MEKSAVILGLSRQAKFLGLPMPYAMAVGGMTVLPFILFKPVWWFLTAPVWYGLARLATKLNPKQIEQIATLKAQLDALRNGLTLEALGIPDPDTFFDDILPDVADLTGGLIAAKDGKYSLMTTSGKVGDKPAGQYVSDFFASVGLDTATVDTLSKSGDPGAARIGTQANTAAFLSAAAETSSVKASESLERVHELVQEIPDTEGLKEAIDLNTRVTAELSIAMANIWNMESAQLMGMGEAGVMDAATAAEEEKFIKVIREE